MYRPIEREQALKKTRSNGRYRFKKNQMTCAANKLVQCESDIYKRLDEILLIPELNDELKPSVADIREQVDKLISSIVDVRDLQMQELDDEFKKEIEEIDKEEAVLKANTKQEAKEKRESKKLKQ